jgi:hypothetical protein
MEDTKKREFPLFAEAFFSLKEEKITQSLYFQYYDAPKIFHNLVKTSAIEGELNSIQENLQNYINEDALHINGHLIKMIIERTELLFRDNNPDYPVLSFFISSTPYRLYSNQINIVHLYAKPEVIPYSAISCWNTSGIIKKVISNSDHKIDKSKHNVSFFLKKGDIVGGHERISIEHI